jgi:CBS-domain-containing membrane protein
MIGHPFLVPNLGPSAYLLAARSASLASAPHRVIDGHTIGMGGGLVSYTLLVSGLTLSVLAVSLSVAGLRLESAATLPMVLTTAAMVETGLRHPPAYATTLLIALGLLSASADTVSILLAVALLVVSTNSSWPLICAVLPLATGNSYSDASATRGMRVRTVRSVRRS